MSFKKVLIRILDDVLFQFFLFYATIEMCIRLTLVADEITYEFSVLMILQLDFRVSLSRVQYIFIPTRLGNKDVF